jgi:hypothetical protein
MPLNHTFDEMRDNEDQQDKPKPDETAAGPRPKKPLGKSWESFTDAIIKQAQREGKFDNLPGSGKPLAGLDGPYDPLWWAKDLLRREDLSYVPSYLALKRQVEQEMKEIASLSSEKAVRERVDQLNADIAKTNATITEGPASTLALLNEDEIVRLWKLRRRDGAA